MDMDMVMIDKDIGYLPAGTKIELTDDARAAWLKRYGTEPDLVSCGYPIFIPERLLDIKT